MILRMCLYKFNKLIKHVMMLGLTVLAVLMYLTKKNPQHVSITHSLQAQKHSSFNPRNIAHLVYQQLNDGAREIEFHWDDWMDLSPGNSILASQRRADAGGACDAETIKYAAVNGYRMESYVTKIKRGMTKLYCTADIPQRIFVPLDDGMVEVNVSNKNRIGIPETTNISKRQLVDEMEKLQTSSSQLTYRKYKQLAKSVNLEAQDFLFDPEYQIFNLKSKASLGRLSDEEKKYLAFLEYANANVDKNDKYFKYPWIYSDLVQGIAHHLAYPFFRGFVGDRERQSVLQHMVRAWFEFTAMNGFTSWINYGSLLGWAYNGVNMPWDTDIDIQIPIVQLDRMGRYFNRSLILENPRYGNAKYYLEVAPSYIRQGNGKNFIDARFIDINSGLYIDISALSHSGFKPPSHLASADNFVVNCKNWNWHTLGELLPIRHTYFEGSSVYIPHNVTQLLTNKYGKSSFTNKPRFKDHNYQDNIMLWVPDEICRESPKNRFDENGELTFEGACSSSVLLDEYRITRKASQRHKDLNQDLDSPAPYSPQHLGDLPIYRKDPWDYYNDLNHHASSDSWYLETPTH